MLKPLGTLKPPILTIVGSAGSGKTSLGGLFEKPVLIQAEDSSTVFQTWDDDVKPVGMPRIELLLKKNKQDEPKDSPIAQAINQIRWLYTNEHDRKTVVIDTVTTLNTMQEAWLADKDDVDNVADASGGFHKGFLTVAQAHAKLRGACEKIRDDKGMTIVFLSHQGIHKIKTGPETDDYTAYSLDMHQNSVATYVNEIDGVFYIRNQEHVMGKKFDKKQNLTKFGKVSLSGERVIVTTGDGRVGYLNAKSRWPIPPEIDYPQGTNPLLDHIPYFNQKDVA